MSEYICPNCGQSTFEKLEKFQLPGKMGEYPAFQCNNKECQMVFIAYQRGKNE